MRQLRRIPFTKEGFEKIKSDYDVLKASRPEAVETLRRARDLGDLSENGLYKAARAQLSSIDGQLSRLEILIKLADVQKTSLNKIGVGSKVKLKDREGVVKYQIVGEYEADPIKKKISTASPIGRALVGKEKGEIVVINLPTKTLTYEVVEVD